MRRFASLLLGCTIFSVSGQLHDAASMIQSSLRSDPSEGGQVIIQDSADQGEMQREGEMQQEGEMQREDQGEQGRSQEEEQGNSSNGSNNSNSSNSGRVEDMAEKDSLPGFLAVPPAGDQNDMWNKISDNGNGKKPILVFVSHEGCPKCADLIRDINNDPNLQDGLGMFASYHIDDTTGQNFRYPGKGFPEDYVPRVYFMNVDGTQIESFSPVEEYPYFFPTGDLLKTAMRDALDRQNDETKQSETDASIDGMSMTRDRASASDDSSTSESATASATSSIDEALATEKAEHEATQADMSESSSTSETSDNTENMSANHSASANSSAPADASADGSVVEALGDENSGDESVDGAAEENSGNASVQGSGKVAAGDFDGDMFGSSLVRHHKFRGTSRSRRKGKWIPELNENHNMSNISKQPTMKLEYGRLHSLYRNG